MKNADYNINNDNDYQFHERRQTMVKHSKQRDAVYNNLCSRTDHPTAEDVYLSLKSSMPALSLATVYRNLALLESENKILRFGSGGMARYDGNISPHYHLSCLDCGGVFDIFMDEIDLTETAKKHFAGKVISQTVMFTGYCSECSKISDN